MQLIRKTTVMILFELTEQRALQFISEIPVQ